MQFLSDDWSVLLSVHVELLNDSNRILDNLGVIGGLRLSERFNDGSNHHLLKLFAALLVNAQISN